MKYIKFILIAFVIACVGYLIAKEYAGSFVNNDKPKIDSAVVNTESIPDGVVMYYFHGNRRCPTCMAIEKYSHEAAMSYISDNKLTWETVNVENAGNKHFVYDFNLASSGPVIVDYKDNKLVRWQALDKVWQLVRNKEEFSRYVGGEIKGFIEFNE